MLKFNFFFLISSGLLDIVFFSYLFRKMTFGRVSDLGQFIRESEPEPDVKKSKGLWCFYTLYHAFGGSDSKASAYNVGDPGSIPGWERSSGEGNGNPVQYSCLENPMRGAW